MNDWQQTFVKRLNAAQHQYKQAFEQAVAGPVRDAFDELNEFLSSNGFILTTPISEPGRNSFKFELSENAYVLMIFRATGVGEFELRCETFVPNHEPLLERVVGQVGEVTRDWATSRFQATLNGFVDRLGRSSTPAGVEPSAQGELAVV